MRGLDAVRVRRSGASHPGRPALGGPARATANQPLLRESPPPISRRAAAAGAATTRTHRIERDGLASLRLRQRVSALFDRPTVAVISAHGRLSARACSTKRSTSCRTGSGIRWRSPRRPSDRSAARARPALDCVDALLSASILRRRHAAIKTGYGEQLRCARPWRSGYTCTTTSGLTRRSAG
jgi:hypothetical protein